MYLIIGRKGCSRCTVIKNMLTSKNIDFEYKLLESLSSEESNEIVKKATKANQINMPLIFKNNEIIDIKEVI